MAIQVGDKIPAATLKTKTADGIKDVTTGELLGGKKVVLFGVPGAFTPTCNDAHLPSFLAKADDLEAKGVDTIACVSVNDVFVTDAWGSASGAAGHVVMLADGNGDFARALGLEADFTAFGMGHRNKRYALVAENGVVRYLGVEPGPGVTVSGGDAVLAAL